LTNEAVIAHYFACLDAEDWDAMRELWHEDGELRAVGARPRDGRDAVLRYFGRLFGYDWTTCGARSRARPRSRHRRPDRRRR
jgi:hypothetical protein